MRQFLRIYAESEELIYKMCNEKNNPIRKNAINKNFKGLNLIYYLWRKGMAVPFGQKSHQKIEFSKWDEEEVQKEIKIQQEQDIEKIFEKRKKDKINNNENQLIVVNRQSIFHRIFRKIMKMIKNSKI